MTDLSPWLIFDEIFFALSYAHSKHLLNGQLFQRLSHKYPPENIMLSLGLARIARRGQSSIRFISVGEVTPSAVVDIVEPINGEFTVRNAQNFGDLLKSHKRAVVFALPGAFTPICSE